MTVGGVGRGSTRESRARAPPEVLSCHGGTAHGFVLGCDTPHVVHFLTPDTENWYLPGVIEKQQVISELGPSGVFAGLRWAHRSAALTTLENLPPAQGYKSQRTRSASLRELLVDRTDRVAQCQDYAPDPSAPQGGKDLLREELHPLLPLTDDILLPPGKVTRNNLRGSEGWHFGDWRWLCASFQYGKINQIRWQSALRQRVASQQCFDQPALFSLGDDEEDLFEAPEVDLSHTLILAQALDPITQQSQLYIGRPRLSRRGEPPWYWLYDLLGAAPEGGRAGIDRTPLAPMPTTPREVADAPVRLRPASGTPAKRSSDQG